MMNLICGIKNKVYNFHFIYLLIFKLKFHIKYTLQSIILMNCWWFLEYVIMILQQFCEIHEKSFTSHIIEFIGNDEFNMWNKK